MALLALALAALSIAEDIKVEVASIKPVPTDERTIFTNGRTIHSSCSLAGQIRWAFDTADFRIEALPKWVANEGYDITAKAEGEDALTIPQFRQMLRTLLADRFQLRVHWVVEELPVYALVIDKGGPRLSESAPGTRRTEKQVNGGLEGTHYDMARLADRLRRELDHRVIDLTGLKGFCDLKLEWTPDQTTATSARRFRGDVPLHRSQNTTRAQAGASQEAACRIPRRRPRREA